MNSTGKVMRRKIGGNRYSLKRRGRHSKQGKAFTDNVMTPEQYRAAKRRDRA